MFYNDKEYCAVLDGLQREEVYNDHGYRVRVRTAPDAVPGGMDPRAASLLRTLNAEPGPEKIDLDNLGPLRSCMNWKSLDITKALINACHRVCTGRSGNLIRLRSYSLAEKSTAAPCIVYFHGGGWIGGEMGYVENLCKLLCERARATVISVEYRFAPEHPFPCGFHDCVDALEHVYAHAAELQIDKGHIAVAGDSAGANFAAATALYDRDTGANHVSFQALLYPSVNPFGLKNPYYTWHENFYEVTSDEETVRNLCIHELPVRRCMEIIDRAYMRGRSDFNNPYASPLFADNFSGVAPALIVTPEYDYLRQEGEAYARRLSADGVAVELLRYRGINHGFAEKIGQYPQAEDCANEVAKAFRSHF